MSDIITGEAVSVNGPRYALRNTVIQQTIVSEPLGRAARLISGDCCFSDRY